MIRNYIVTQLTNLAERIKNANRARLVVPVGVSIYYPTTPEIEDGLDFASRYQGFESPESFGVDIVDGIYSSGKLDLDGILLNPLIGGIRKYFENSSGVFLKKTQVSRNSYLSDALRIKLCLPYQAATFANYLTLAHFSHFLQGSSDAFEFEHPLFVRSNEMAKGEFADFDLLNRLREPLKYQFPNEFRYANSNQKIKEA